MHIADNISDAESISMSCITQGALFWEAKPLCSGDPCTDACDCTTYTDDAFKPTDNSEYLKGGTQEVWVGPYGYCSPLIRHAPSRSS